MEFGSYVRNAVPPCRSAAHTSDMKIFDSAPTAIELYESVKGEVKNALKAADETGIKAHALYWVVPDVHFSGAITVEKAMEELNYDGFKIHPRAQDWDLGDTKNLALADKVFSYAEEHKKRILIHAGDDLFENPRVFESLISLHPSVTVQIAHCRPVSDTLYILKEYPNVVCDTAMASDESIRQIKQAGYESRLCYGSDFPITHWQKERPQNDPTKQELVEFALKQKTVWCISALYTQ